MAVDKLISLNLIKSELKGCEEIFGPIPWDNLGLDENAQAFKVQMVSSIDQEKFLIEVKFDNYKEYPLLIEFLEPDTGIRGSKKAYPKCSDSFFHPMPCICHPCSRKAYKSFDRTAPHQDWQLAGWQSNSGIGSLKDVCSILVAIYSRINNTEFYKGRMEK